MPDSRTADIDELTSPTFLKEQTEQADSILTLLMIFRYILYSRSVNWIWYYRKPAEFLTKNMLVW